MNWHNVGMGWTDLGAKWITFKSNMFCLVKMNAWHVLMEEYCKTSSSIVNENNASSMRFFSKLQKDFLGKTTSQLTPMLKNIWKESRKHGAICKYAVVYTSV